MYVCTRLQSTCKECVRGETPEECVRGEIPPERSICQGLLRGRLCEEGGSAKREVPHLQLGLVHLGGDLGGDCMRRLQGAAGSSSARDGKLMSMMPRPLNTHLAFGLGGVLRLGLGLELGFGSRAERSPADGGAEEGRKRGGSSRSATGVLVRPVAMMVPLAAVGSASRAAWPLLAGESSFAQSCARSRVWTRMALVGWDGMAWSVRWVECEVG